MTDIRSLMPGASPADDTSPHEPPGNVPPDEKAAGAGAAAAAEPPGVGNAGNVSGAGSSSGAGNVGGSVSGDNRAQTHLGNGDIKNIVNLIDLAKKRVRRPEAISGATLRELSGVFVRPTGFADAAEKIEKHRLVLLSGSPGDGIHAAAWMLVAGAGGARAGTERIERIPADVEADDEPDIPQKALDDQARYLLDLSESMPSRSEELAKRLEALRDVVAGSARYLAVILPPDSVRWLPAELRRLVPEMSRPDWRAVLQSHLAVSMQPSAQPDLATIVKIIEKSADLADLGAATLYQVSRVAVASAKLLGMRPGAALPDCLRLAWREVKRQDSDYGKEIDCLLENDRTGMNALLLITAAMLEDADRDLVFVAQRELARAGEFRLPDDHALTRPGFLARLGEIGVVRDEQRPIRFEKTGFGVAARHYAWDNYPTLRPAFLDWAERLPSPPGIFWPNDVLTRFAERFTEESLRSDRADDALDLAYHWIGRRRVAAIPACLGLLTKGLEEGAEGTGGRKFRQRIRAWSEDHRLDAYLARMCIELSGKIIYDIYPFQALTRLHNFAAHENPQVASAAIDAVETLASADRDNYRYVLGRSVRAPYAVRGSTGNAEVFLRLVSASRLYARDAVGWRPVDDPECGELFRGGWILVLEADAPPSKETIGLVHLWLDDVVQAVGRGPTILPDLLVDALRERFDLLSSLRAILGRWVDRPLGDSMAPDQAAVRTYLLDRIDKELFGEDVGLRPPSSPGDTQPSPAAGREEQR